MAEYIERDEAIRKTLEACVKIVGHGISQIDAVDIVEIMESIPTANVVEVIRCKDCRFNVANMIIDKLDATDYSGEDIVCSYFMTDGLLPTDYCSYAERSNA